MPSSHIRPAIASTALWRPTSSTNIRISPAPSRWSPARSRAPRRPACRSSRARAPARAARTASLASSVASACRRTVSISSIRSPNTVPWPQPVVVVRFAIFASRSARPWRVVTATASVSQSTCTATMSSMRLDQALVAQIADRQRLGRGAERHQRHDLALVDVERERMLAGDRRRHASRRAR